MQEESFLANIEVFLNYFNFVVMEARKNNSNSTNNNNTKDGARLDELFTNIINTRSIFRNLNNY